MSFPRRQLKAESSMLKVKEAVLWYLLTGCCRYKAKGAQTYNTCFKRLLQASGNAVDAAPCEQIRFVQIFSQNKPQKPHSLHKNLKRRDKRGTLP